MLSVIEIRKLMSDVDVDVRRRISEQLDAGRVYEAQRLLAEALGAPDLAAEIIASMIKAGEGNGS
jgi:hypothetical protein